MTTVRLGAIAWVLAAQFFVAQVVIAWAWSGPFDLTERYISDLGNTVCGPYPAGSTTLVCSPWYVWMNASFILLGVTMSAGALLTRRAFRPTRLAIAARVFFVLAGVGVALVGLFPENVNMTMHAAGAGMNFVLGNAALVLFGLTLGSDSGRSWRWFGFCAGCLGLAGTALFVAGAYLGLGPGGMERVAAYPMPIWQIAMGLMLLGRS
jgi:hypothetical membrane protein